MSDPRPDSSKTERPTYERIADALEGLYDVYTPEGVGMWLRGAKRSFDGRSPLEVLRQGHLAAFENRIEQLRDGAMG